MAPEILAALLGNQEKAVYNYCGLRQFWRPFAFVFRTAQNSHKRNTTGKMKIFIVACCILLLLSLCFCAHELKGKKIDPRTIAAIKRDLSHYGNKIKFIARQHNISERTVSRIASNNYNNNNKRGRKLHNSEKNNATVQRFIFALLRFNPFMKLGEVRYLVQIGLNLTISISYLSRLIRFAIGLNRRRLSKVAKARQSARIIKWRQEFRSVIRFIDPSYLCFIDESHFSFHNSTRTYGWTPPGMQLQVPCQTVSTQRFSLVAAMTQARIPCFELFNTTRSQTIDGERFAHFIQRLLTIIPPAMFIVLDNASIHHAPEVKAIIMEHRSRFLFTSAYSPDYNAIELLFGHIKAKIKNFAGIACDLKRFIIATIGTVAQSTLFNFVAHTTKKYQD